MEIKDMEARGKWEGLVPCPVTGLSLFVSISWAGLGWDTVL